MVDGNGVANVDGNAVDSIKGVGVEVGKGRGGWLMADRAVCVSQTFVKASARAVVCASAALLDGVEVAAGAQAESEMIRNAITRRIFMFCSFVNFVKPRDWNTRTDALSLCFSAGRPELRLRSVFRAPL